MRENITKGEGTINKRGEEGNYKIGRRMTFYRGSGEKEKLGERWSRDTGKINGRKKGR